MRPNSIIFCLLLVISTGFLSIAKAQANIDDSLALVDLYNSTNGPGWINKQGWLTKRPISKWRGIVMHNGRVWKIELDYNNLKGKLPASIGNLRRLARLVLEGNQLSDTIPASFCNLINLKMVYLFDNQLSGSIPASIGNLTKLEVLWLGKNQLTGKIPYSIGKLTNLGALYLYSNKLSGTIPSSIGNMKELTEFNVQDNQLSGDIPLALTKLPKLNYLSLWKNQFSGPIPSFLGKIVTLESIQLGDNQFTGHIPNSFKNLVNLVQLGLNNNHLSGAIPSFLGDMEHLYWVDLNYNEFTGSIPESIFKRNIGYFNVDHNQLSEEKNMSLSIPVQLVSSGNVSYNRFTFNGLEGIAEKFPNYLYAPQANISVHKHNNTLAVSAGGTISNNTYTWVNVESADSTIIKGDSTFVPTKSGKYYVKVTNAVATQLTLYSDTFNFTLAAAKESDQLITKTNTGNSTPIKVYPNPAKDVVHVQVKGEATIMLTNSTGKLILSRNINNKGQINVSSLANGVYYIKGKSANGRVENVQKIVVVH